MYSSLILICYLPFLLLIFTSTSVGIEFVSVFDFDDFVILGSISSQQSLQNEQSERPPSNLWIHYLGKAN